MKKGTRIKKQYRLTFLNKEIERTKRILWNIENGKYKDFTVADQRYDRDLSYLRGLEKAKKLIKS